ncbi:phosphohydrolase [candidate division KSB3 bacterium]|uniref:Phosphohydrolase n=1 Tax=candidate division KSB3 bacterium TaxID=2044937 RepID=A0A2G6E9W6_9BACT|nr:MAG: phosphohydrolase [candidate division KSB3 bacterium]PIE30945.1 MAG: phosphohydrolase [candidate division KSB3 bacterium]
MHDILQQQIEFLTEIDKLKQIFRRTYLMDASRKENDAEHSWHLAMMALLLKDSARSPDLDIFHIIKMLLIHDIVEIDAGDTYLYDEDAARDKAEREQNAADRLFGLLPGEQARELRSLWDEFEEQSTPEAKFAASLDRFQPLLHNYATKGKSWQEHGVTSEKVLKRCSEIQAGSPALWEYAERLIHQAVQQGYLEQ